jgi:protein SCO1
MRSLRWIAFAAACLFIGGTPRAQDPPSKGPGLDEKLGSTAALDVALRDEQGREVTFGSLVDRPTILTLNFFRCAGICTPLLNGLVDGLNKLDLEPAKDYQVLTVSFDPTDTPEMAAQKRQNYISQIKRPFPESGWRFLTGDAAQTRRLCDSVGFSFEASGDQFLHPACLVFLSPKGKIVRYMYGITFLPFDMKMALTEAAEGKVGSTIQKSLLFCYSYDPAGKRYVLNVTRIAAVATILFVLAFVLFLAMRRKKIDAPGSAP